MRRNQIIAGLTTALALAAVAGPAQADTPAAPAASAPTVHIKNCALKQSRNAGGFVSASCAIVLDGTATSPISVRFRSNLTPFNPGTLGPWRKQSGTVSLGDLTTIKFAYRHKTLSQVRKSLKVTISGATGAATITDGTAVAAS